MNARLASLTLAFAGVLGASTLGCNGSQPIYVQSDPNGYTTAAPSPTYADGSLTPEGCAHTSDRMCEIVLRENGGSSGDLGRCRTLNAYGDMQAFCVAKSSCLGRQFYDCMDYATNSAQADRCATEADKRCGTYTQANAPRRAVGPTDGWVRHASRGGFSVLMPASVSGEGSDSPHMTSATSPAGELRIGWIDNGSQMSDADLDAVVAGLKLKNAKKKRITVLGKYRGVEVEGTHVDGHRVHERVFGVGPRYFFLIVLNEQDSTATSAFFDSFQLL